MAVKTVKKTSKAKKDVEVKEIIEETTPEVVEEVEIEVPTVDEEIAEIEVDNEAVEDDTVVSKNVRVKVKKDHRCYIGGELYDLKEGQCYNVPEFVKMVLNRAGILSPL